MIYQRISLSTSAPVGDPGPLPFAVAGWAGNPELLADLSDIDPAYELEDAGFWPVEILDPPAVDTDAETLSEGGLVADAANKRFVRQWVVTPLPIETRKAAKLDALAAKRWQVETGGITVAGMPVKTDEDTQRKITGAYVQAARDAGFTVKWKIGTGVFVDLDATAIIAIGDAVTAHIQAAFAHEAALSAAIIAAADTGSLSAINIESGWPG